MGEAWFADHDWRVLDRADPLTWPPEGIQELFELEYSLTLSDGKKHLGRYVFAGARNGLMVDRILFRDQVALEDCLRWAPIVKRHRKGESGEI